MRHTPYDLLKIKNLKRLYFRGGGEIVAGLISFEKIQFILRVLARICHARLSFIFVRCKLFRFRRLPEKTPTAKSYRYVRTYVTGKIERVSVPLMWLGRRVSIIIYLGMSAPRTCRRTWWRRIRLWASPPDQTQQTRKRWLKNKRRKRYDIKWRAFSSAAGSDGRPSLIPCPRLNTDLVFRNEKRAVDLVVGQQERHVERFEVFFVVGHDDPVSERVQTVVNVLEHTIDIVNRRRRSQLISPSVRNVYRMRPKWRPRFILNV